MGINDTDPDIQSHLATKTTDPGIAPPKVEAPPRQDPPGEITPVLPPPSGPASVRAPRVAVILEGTPVPPEATDALLAGLARAETDAYFHKAKPASESHGEAAVAFASGPRPLPAANPTPPPQPAVMLRRSLEMDIIRAAQPVEPPPPPAEPPPRRRSPSAGDVFGGAVTQPRQAEPDPPAKPVRPKWVDRGLAFGATALIATIVGVVTVRLLSPAAPEEGTSPTASNAAAPGPPIAAPPARSAVAVPPVPTDTPSALEANAPPTPTGRPSAAPSASALPPKSDVKRAM